MSTTKTTPRLDPRPTTTISTPLVMNLNVQATTTTSPESTATLTQSTLSPKKTTTLNKDEDSIMGKILESQKSKPSTTTTTEVPTVKQKVDLMLLSSIKHIFIDVLFLCNNSYGDFIYLLVKYMFDRSFILKIILNTFSS